MNKNMLAKTRVYYAGKYYNKGETIPNVTKKDAHVLLHLDRASYAPVVQKIKQEPKPEPVSHPEAKRPYTRRDMAAVDETVDPDAKPKRRYSRRDKKVED